MKSKTTAALLALFLGGWGGHKFYLGKPGLGILYLIFCWTFIPSCIAFVEFIMFLCQDQASFDREYNSAYVNQEQPTQQSYAQPQQLMAQPVASQQELNAPLLQSGKTKAEQILELKSLLDQGALSQEDFDAEKQKVLNS